MYATPSSIDEKSKTQNASLPSNEIFSVWQTATRGGEIRYTILLQTGRSYGAIEQQYNIIPELRQNLILLVIALKILAKWTTMWHPRDRKQFFIR